MSKCKFCGGPVPYDDDFDMDVCPDCYEVAEERSRRRREWDYYHPSEPCPPEELEP
jgi:predicted nucleic acid-binding Zn ribbon protein